MTNSTKTKTITSTPLVELLMVAPQAAVPAVERALRHVAAGEWKQAAQQMNAAAETSDADDEWFNAAGKAADELHHHYYR